MNHENMIIMKVPLLPHVLPSSSLSKSDNMSLFAPTLNIFDGDKGVEDGTLYQFVTIPSIWKPTFTPWGAITVINVSEMMH